ncbi:MAG: MFS transporter [Anaerolineae bacterium]|nr:MFS transporter [Anaerolineae bacterium]MBT7070167.1 MFS transporter [Anaerolineae bacterium]MBT7324308.1 MFS transporter [Anaerolineae bacterium]
MQKDTQIQTQADDGFQEKKVFVIVAGHFIHDSYSAFLAPLLPLLIEKLSLTLTMAGSLSAFMQAPALLNPIIGRLADKSSVRYFVVAAPAVTGTLMSVMGVAPNYYALAILLVITGVSVSAFHAPAPAMVARASGKRVGKAMGWFMAGGELGRTLGPIIAVWAATTWTLEGMARMAIIGWIASFILYWRLKDIPVQKKKEDTERNLLPKMWAVFLPLGIIILFRAFMTVSMTTYLPTFMNMKGANLWLAGAALSIMESAGVAGALLSGAISDRIGRKSVFLIASITAPLFMLAFLNVRGWLLVPVLLLLGFTSLSVGPVILALVQDHFPDDRAAANGFFMLLSLLARSLGALVVGFAGDQFGLDKVFLWSALIAFLVLPGVFMLPEEGQMELSS